MNEKLLYANYMLQNSSDGMLVTNKKGDILATNLAFANITGYSEDDIINKNISILTSGRHDDEFFNKMWKELYTNGSWQDEIYNRHKNGEIFLVWLKIIGMRNDKNEISHFVGIFSDINKNKISDKRFNYLAYHDVLTELPNRLLFNDRLQQAIFNAKRNNKLVGLVYLDLDRFKIINDTMGYSVGDMLLKGVAERLTESLRTSDTVSRLGNDEFALILRGVNTPQDVAKATQKALDSLSKCFTIDGHEIYIAASAGIAIFPNDADNIKTLLKNSDTALLHAEEQGKHNYKFYDESMNNSLLNRYMLETSMHRALEREEFFLYYQPQIDLKTGSITGLEVLVHWQHPDGHISAANFIPLAEETGLIIPIGEWLLYTACKQAKVWQEKGFPPITIAVNFSARQFEQANLLETIEQTLFKTGLDPKYLEIELTESILMKKIDKTISMLDKLKKKGVKISIDDFGTGYSSLNYLKRFPIDKLKIDQSFVQDIENFEDAAIVKAVISMGHSLSMEVIAEGVETKEQLSFLREYNCEKAQGYYFSRPLSAEAFTTLLQTKRSFSLTD